MTNHYEDLILDEGYWQSLLAEAERILMTPTRHDHSMRELPGIFPDALANAPDGMTEHAPSKERHEPPHKSDQDQTWVMLDHTMRTGNLVEVEVTGCNRGGLIVLYRGMRGFIPSSHVHSITPDCDESERRSNLAGNIGQILAVRIIELDPAHERVVFSERERHQEAVLHEIPRVLTTLHAGDTCRGAVTNLTNFGAFVDLGGYEGLVHVSELAWSRVNHPRDLLHIGQEVNVYVMSISPQEGRIALSLKRARQNPWESVEQRYQIGQIVRGIVTNVVQFGAFIKVEDDLEGLVHVSELADGIFMHPRNVVHEGDEVTARVIGVDGRQHRLALSMRDVRAHP
jgi:small subunit ribosomal protein S1